MKKEEWESIVAAAAAGNLSDDQMRGAIAQVDTMLQFVRQQVHYGRSAPNWQRSALDNIQQRIG